LITRKATYIPYPQGVPLSFAIEKKDRPPCNIACPAHINVQGYVAMVREGKYREAVEIIMEDMPLPGVLGRVCVRFCENVCRRAEVDQPVSIKELKRFAADKVDILSIPLPDITPREERIAIIGSGPSGLSAAYFLAIDGYKPTIFEALHTPGGMLAVGIPEYRLPRGILKTEIENIKRYGVEIKTDAPIGKDRTLDSLFDEGYKAVYIATGAHRGMSLTIPGEDEYKNFHQCAPWLKEVNLGRIQELKGKVLVFGGGNAAVDAARMSIRLGADEVHIVYRRSKDEMPADPLEIKSSLDEGVILHTLVSPKAIIGDNGLLIGMECIKNTLGEPDSTGRRRPIPIEGSEFSMAADHIIAAIGQSVDGSFATGNNLKFTENGLISVNTDTLQTARDGIFAGGDVVTGPQTVIEAIAQGKKAALSIAAYIQGKEVPKDDYDKDVERSYNPIDINEPKINRAEVPEIDVSERIKNFNEVNVSMDEEAARREASRCLNCGVCAECFQCVEACKAQAIDHNMTDAYLDIDVGAILLSPGADTFNPSKYTQYKYAKHPNVITAMEFERILCSSGPYEGNLLRPSDKKEPKKIAWIQCVGSRDLNHCDHSYCSSVCCMYAIKEALIAREHSHKGLDCAIFYIDMRAYGKDFDRYYNRAIDSNIRFIRSRIASVEEVPFTDDLEITYTNESHEAVDEQFDLVVLSVGFLPKPPPSARWKHPGQASLSQGHSTPPRISPPLSQMPVQQQLRQAPCSRMPDSASPR